MSYQNDFLHNMPHDLTQVIYEVGAKTQAPIPLVLSSMIAALATAYQGYIDVELPMGTVVPTSTYTLAIAKSGERKSSVDRILAKPLHEYQEELENEHKLLMDNYILAFEKWKVKFMRVRNRFKAAVQNEHPDLEQIYQEFLEQQKKEPKEPVEGRLMYNDVTLEALLYGMSENPNALLISTDASNILRRFNPNYLANINLLWDGDSVRVDRKTSKSFTVEEGRLTALLMIQPDIFKLLVDKNDDAIRNIGALARMLVCCPESTQGNRPYMEVYCDPKYSYLEKFHKRIREMLLEMREYQVCGERLIIRFSPEAKQAWVDFYNHIETQLGWQGHLSDVHDFASKISNNVGRLAALIHYYTHGTTEISLDSALAAIDLGYFFTAEFKRLFGEKTLAEQAYENGCLLYNWLIKNHKPGIYIWPKKFLYSYGPNRLRNKETLEMALWNLHESGLIVYYPNAKPGACIQLTQRFLLENHLQ